MVVLGIGEGSKYIGWTLGKQGRKIAVIERKYIGGSCPNIACLPSKNVIHSAKVASYLRRSEEFGVNKENFTIDMAGVRDRKRKMVAGLVEMHLDNFKESGAELVVGSARFSGPRTLEVSLADGTKRRLRGDKVIIGTETRATLDAIPGLATFKMMTFGNYSGAYVRNCSEFNFCIEHAGNQDLTLAGWRAASYRRKYRQTRR